MSTRLSPPLPDALGRPPPCRAGGMFSRMLGAACSMLHSLHDISERPDVADDTFLLAGRALSYAPRLLLTPQLLAALLDSALAGLLVQHREACCSILAFVVRLLDPATHRACAPEAVAHLQGALVPRAPLLVRLVLAGVTGALPTNRLAELADVLYALLKVNGTWDGWGGGARLQVAVKSYVGWLHWEDTGDGRGDGGWGGGGGGAAGMRAPGGWAGSAWLMWFTCMPMPCPPFLPRIWLSGRR